MLRSRVINGIPSVFRYTIQNKQMNMIVGNIIGRKHIQNKYAVIPDNIPYHTKKNLLIDYHTNYEYPESLLFNKSCKIFDSGSNDREIQYIINTFLSIYNSRCKNTLDNKTCHLLLTKLSIDIEKLKNDISKQEDSPHKWYSILVLIFMQMLAALVAYLIMLIMYGVIVRYDIVLVICAIIITLVVLPELGFYPMLALISMCFVLIRALLPNKNIKD